MGSLETFSIIVHGWGCDCHPAGGARDAAKHPTMLRTAAPTNSCPAPVSKVPKLSNPVFNYKLHEDSDFLFTALSRCLEHSLARSGSSMDMFDGANMEKIVLWDPKKCLPIHNCMVTSHSSLSLLLSQSENQKSLSTFPSVLPLQGPQGLCVIAHWLSPSSAHLHPSNQESAQTVRSCVFSCRKWSKGAQGGPFFPVQREPFAAFPFWLT